MIPVLSLDQTNNSTVSLRALTPLTPRDVIYIRLLSRHLTEDDQDAIVTFANGSRFWRDPSEKFFFYVKALTDLQEAQEREPRSDKGDDQSG